MPQLDLEPSIRDLRASAFGIKGKSFDNLEYEISEIMDFFGSLSEDDLKKKSEQQALKLFSLAVKNIPAYKRFLTSSRFNPSQVKTYRDFKNVPITDKKNYFFKYPLNELCWQGKISKSNIIALSSGSTGRSLFWPRGHLDEVEATIYHEIVLNNAFQIEKKETLIICCYAMGSYVGGLFSANILNKIGERGKKIVVSTPGIQKEDIYSVFTELKDYFDQVIFFGYPPFIKDVLEDGKTEHNIWWKEKPIHFMFSSENFSVEFVKYIRKLVGSEKAIVQSIYASSEAAVIGYGSQLIPRLREIANGNASLKNELFYSNVLPSVHQYNPISKFLEIIKNEIVITSFGMVPLIRYNIHDRGGILSYATVKRNIGNSRDNEDSEPIKLPYVYLFGRNDLTATIYGVKVYPENIKEIFRDPNLSKFFSGRFVMNTKFDRNQNQFLSISLERNRMFMKKKISKKEIRKKIFDVLKENNKEFRTLYKSVPDVIIKISFVREGEKHFGNIGLKHKYVTNET